jgi:peptidoglycan/xylan/chitin deacetylase (PgdA/CDA1 family)
MRRRPLLCASVVLASFSLSLSAQGRTVAITVDDLPYVGAGFVPSNGSDLPSVAAASNARLLAAFRARHVPVTGFVIQTSVESLGSVPALRILRQWTAGGFDLGNHTYSHPDINELSSGQVEQEILRGESAIAPLMKESGKQLKYFRFPMNHTGGTKEQHGKAAAFLRDRGYRLATCTIDNSDYVFNRAYVRALAGNDAETAEKLRNEYLAYTGTEIDYYASLNKQVLGYEPPQVMLLHDNRLNGDVIEQVLALFEERQYKFVSLDEAQSDAAYQIPDTYITKSGPMWGYRWARERKVKVDGAKETDPPKWISEYLRERPLP